MATVPTDICELPVFKEQEVVSGAELLELSDSVFVEVHEDVDVCLFNLWCLAQLLSPLKSIRA